MSDTQWRLSGAMGDVAPQPNVPVDVKRQMMTQGIGFPPRPVDNVPPQDSGEFDRDNWAIYGDLEHDITDDWLMQYALRYEDFSDFGDTTNGKIATRYNITEGFTIRGAASTGFHAPTPGQANVRTTITTFDAAVFTISIVLSC